MNFLNKAMGAITATLLVLAALPQAAHAGVTITTYDFYGLCDDCAGPSGAIIAPGTNLNDGIFQEVTGILTLLDYTPGDNLVNANFMSFTYDGSTIVSPFTVLAGDLEELTGRLDAAGNVTPSVVILWDEMSVSTAPLCATVIFACGLRVRENGEWFIRGDITLDEGIRGTFAGIPEPGTLALFGLGLAGLGLARRKAVSHPKMIVIPGLEPLVSGLKFMRCLEPLQTGCFQGLDRFGTPIS